MLEWLQKISGSSSLTPTLSLAGAGIRQHIQPYAKEQVAVEIGGEDAHSTYTE